MLGFIALVPWLLALDRETRFRGALLDAWAMSVAYTAVAFTWLASAIGSYTGIGDAAALALLLAGAPLFQPQFLAFALVRHLARTQPAVLRAFAAAAAWLATEWLVPRLIDDTFGYGLHPSALLRQAADIGGVPGLTLLLLLANEAVAASIRRRNAGVRAIALPLALAVLVPLVLAAYGLFALSPSPSGGQALRVGLVQSNITDYERLRRERGAGAVVREVLDTHYAMSYDAVERQRVDAVLWSETVYPTTFGRPKSEAGAELDREILEIVNAAGVPFVFGTYDRDAEGEYNAAAFVAPGGQVVGAYRKARPFPVTEYVPPWLDGPAFRRAFPWAGTWLPGTGARVFPLRLRDGREVPVLPLICLDDMDIALAADGARLGAQAILTLSNDAWFTREPRGAELHLAAAAFRSIETRLPQFRVTTNGVSAVIDPTGSVRASSRMGERTLVVGELPVREAAPTLVVAWGNWVGAAAAMFLVALAVVVGLWRWWKPSAVQASRPTAPLPAQVFVLTPAARWIVALLRTAARVGLLGIAVAALLGVGQLQSNTFALVRAFLAFFLAPEIAGWLVLRAFAARAAVEGGSLVLTGGRQRMQLELSRIAGVEPWRLPVPVAGALLRMAAGERWPYGITVADPAAFSVALRAAGAPVRPATHTAMSAYVAARAAFMRPRLGHPLAKFVLLSLVLAAAAFRLHQHIAFGSGLGEIYTFGVLAWLKGFGLWWAAWAIGVVLAASVLRLLVEAAGLLAARLRPAAALDVRRFMEYVALGVLYGGLPAWLLVRMLAG